MTALTATGLLHAWELGLTRPPTERALAVLAAADGRVSFEDLARLPIGDRDSRLLALREATFGPRYQALASCPSCGERLELTFEAADIQRTPRLDVAAPTLLRLGDYTLEVRPLDSTDLTAAAGCDDVAAARSVLARRCIGSARLGDTPVAPEAIPDELIPELAAHLEVLDPDADTSLDVTCSACGARSEAGFDIAGYLWTEIEAAVFRLLRDVHGLSRGYGWREADILAMSPLRRRAYLELVQT